jgi:hypothetical protein
VVSDPNASGCTIDDTSDIVNVYFSPTSVSGTLTGGQAVCYPTNSTTFTLSGKTGNVIRWEYATNSNFTSNTDITSTSTTLTATNVPSDRYYRAVVKSGSCPEANSNGELIDVNTTYTWEGDISTDFGTANNWVEGCVPHTGANISFRTSSNPDRICFLDQNRTLNNITVGGSSATHISP